MRPSSHVDASSALERTISRLRSWGEGLFAIWAFLAPLIYVCASIDAHSFRTFIPEALAAFAAAIAPWLWINYRLLPTALRRKAEASRALARGDSAKRIARAA